MCIENTAQISKTIGITLQINDTMKKINGLMESEQTAVNSVPNSEELLENIATSLGIVKQEYGEYCNKIEKRPKI